MPPTHTHQRSEYLNHPSSPPTGPAPTVSPYKEPPWGDNYGNYYLFSVPLAAVEAPVKPCLKFLSRHWLISIKWEAHQFVRHLHLDLSSHISLNMITIQWPTQNSPLPLTSSLYCHYFFPRIIDSAVYLTSSFPWVQQAAKPWRLYSWNVSWHNPSF